MLAQLCSGCRLDSSSLAGKARIICLVAGLTVVLSCFYLFRYPAWEVVPAEVSEPESPPPPPPPPPPPKAVAHVPVYHGPPPLYSQYHNAELRLPQQDWNKTTPSEDEKFFFVSGHTRALGWGNAIQEHLLNAYLAYRAGRRFVFDNFTWNDDGSLYSDYNGHDIPSQVPYSVMIRGPAAGEPFPLGDNAPLAVTKDYFDHLCPTKLEFDRNQVHERMATKTNASLMTDTWTELLHETDDPCVQTTKGSGPIYTHNAIFGERASLIEVWPLFAASPIMTHFRWSSLVELAFDANRAYFYPPSALVSEPYLSASPHATNAARYPPIPGLLVLHVRRGDYLQHCTTLAHWSEDFVSVNALPGMPDPWTIPPHEQRGHNSDENIEIYRQRCFLTIPELVRRVGEVRRSEAARGVRRAYIMTNGHPEFVRELKLALARAGEWDMIASSRDMVLSWEQKFVAQAIDQLIAQRAQVLLGNGFSTLTSNAVAMRLANGLPMDTNRFW